MELERDPHWDRGDTTFTLGLSALVLALVSPVSYFDTTLQWDHMLQHVLLLLVAPPLILLADPFRTTWAGYLVAQRGASSPDGRRPSRALPFLHSRAGAFVVVLAFCIDILVWHVPSVYNATLRIAAVHDIEHLTFLGVGLLFWDQVISPLNVKGRLSVVGRATVVLVGMFISWGLAIGIGYASHPLYAYPAPTGGFTLLADQEIAAGVMWVPGSVPFLIALLYLGIRWFELDDPKPSSALVAPR